LTLASPARSSASEIPYRKTSGVREESRQAE
jgi:hypothetical protein